MAEVTPFAKTGGRTGGAVPTREDGPRPPERRGIYLLPNLFTTAALFCGFFAIIAAVNGRFESAAVAIFVAMVLDGIDGRVARLTNTQSAFGAEYDSLSDMCSFGLAPALVVYLWALHDLGKLGWVAAFMYVAAAALRLARYNTQLGTADRRYFQGLPSPAAGALVAGLVWFGVDYRLTLSRGFDVAACGLTMAAALLMVSKLRYHSFKQLDLRSTVPFVTVLLVVLGFVLISLDPAMILFGLFVGYAVSGPVVTLVQRHRRRQSRRSALP